MFWMRNKENRFLIRSPVWRSTKVLGTFLEIDSFYYQLHIVQKVSQCAECKPVELEAVICKIKNSLTIALSHWRSREYKVS